jgi:hypothetical protein
MVRFVGVNGWRIPPRSTAPRAGSLPALRSGCPAATAQSAAPRWASTNPRAVRSWIGLGPAGPRGTRHRAARRVCAQPALTLQHSGCLADEEWGVNNVQNKYNGFHRITTAGHRDKALEYGKDVWMRYTLPMQHRF